MYIQNIYSRASSFLVRENAMILFNHKKTQTNKQIKIDMDFFFDTCYWLISRWLLSQRALVLNVVEVLINYLSTINILETCSNLLTQM